VLHTDSSKLAQVDDLVRGSEGEVLAHIITAAARASDHRNIGDDEPHPGREFLGFRRQHIGRDNRVGHMLHDHLDRVYGHGVMATIPAHFDPNPAPCRYFTFEVDPDLPRAVSIDGLGRRFAVADDVENRADRDRLVVGSIVRMMSDLEETFGGGDSNERNFTALTFGVHRSNASSIDRIARTSSRVGTMTASQPVMDTS
jgi:hypothetical protein